MSEVLHSGVFINGAQCAQFCHEFAAYCGTEHAIGVNSGTDALTFSLKALHITKGDEVIVPSHTYIATFLAVIHAGADPVPVECDLASGTILPDAVEAAITSRTKAIIPVHLYGRPCNMTALMRIAERHGVPLVEDNAQAQGALWNGRRTGSFGTINATSFYPTKNMGALGDGGAITTNDAHLAELVRTLGNLGSPYRGLHTMIGWNSRLDELQAAFLRIKLQHLERSNLERRAQAAYYDMGLQDLETLKTPMPDVPEAQSVHHVYVVRSPDRDALMEHLRVRGIGTLIHYPIPPHLQPAMAAYGWAPGAFHAAEALSTQSLSLPLYPGLGREEQDMVIDAVRSFCTG